MMFPPMMVESLWAMPFSSAVPPLPAVLSPTELGLIGVPSGLVPPACTVPWPGCCVPGCPGCCCPFEELLKDELPKELPELLPKLDEEFPNDELPPPKEELPP